MGLEDNYSFSQINQITKGLKEKVDFVDKINKSCTPEQIKLYCDFYKHTRYDNPKAPMYYEKLAENFNIFSDFSEIPKDCNVMELDHYFKIAKKIGVKKANDIFTKNVHVSSIRTNFIDKYCKLENFPNYLFISNDEEIINYLLDVTKEKGEFIINTFLKDKTKVTVDIKSLFNFLKKLEAKNSLPFKDFKNILNKLNLETIDIYSNFLSYNSVDTFIELLNTDLPSCTFQVIGRNSHITIDIIEEYKDFFTKHNEFFCSNVGESFASFLNTFKPNKTYLEKIENKIGHCAYAEISLLGDMADYYDTAKRYNEDVVNKNLFMEKISFIFEDTFDVSQKIELGRNIMQQSRTGFIVDLVDNTYSPEQISLLRNELIKGKNIKNALNSHFSVEHMKHIIYYNSKNIFFEDDKAYDIKYVSDKNADYNQFLSMYDEIVGDNRRSSENKITEISILNNLNKKYNLNMNIEKLSENYYVYEQIIKILEHCEKSKENPSIYLNENTTYNDIIKALDNFEGEER